MICDAGQVVPAFAAGDSDAIRYGVLAFGVLGLLAYFALQWRGVARSGQSIGKRVDRPLT